MKIRTVVTGHDAQGKARVTADRETEATTVPLMPGYGFHMLWSSASVPTFPDDGRQAPCPTYFPPVGRVALPGVDDPGAAPASAGGHGHGPGRGAGARHATRLARNNGTRHAGTGIRRLRL